MTFELSLSGCRDRLVLQGLSEASSDVMYGRHDTPKTTLNYQTIFLQVTCKFSVGFSNIDLQK